MIQNRHYWIYLGLAALSLGGYLLWSSWFYTTGFPLDDAWIHQTYARNLARSGIWAFQQGSPSAGSTAPFWTLLLVPGHLLRLAPLTWNFFLGVLTLGALAAVGARGIAYFAPRKKKLAWFAGGLLIFEWHLVWAAGSGMETLLFGVISLYLLVSLLSEDLNPFVSGLVIGAAVWLRPDGITLSGPLFFVLLLRGQPTAAKVRDVLRAVFGLMLLILPYLVFNHALSGEVLPSTFFAKQTEYAVLRQLPLTERLGGQLLIPLVGPGIAALPGLFLSGYKGIQRRDWGVLAGLLWLFGMAVLYALRLPVTYQHGRYLIPVVPVWLVWGFGPLLQQVKIHTNKLLPRVLSRAGLLLTISLAVVFYVVGGRAYARDVAIIESEMVQTAKWIAANLSGPQDVPIAAHDIGALGYYGGRPILDLAGLVSPEVIPIMRDEPALAEYLDQSGIVYFVTLEGWYPELERGLPVVYRTNAPIGPAAGGTNMIVYRWGEP